MVKLLIFLIVFSGFIYAQDPMSEIAHAMQNASFDRLPEFEQAYGHFNGEKAEDNLSGYSPFEKNEIYNVMAEARYNQLDQREQYNIQITLDNLNGQIESKKDDFHKEYEGIVYKCLETQKPEFIILNRRLEIEVQYLTEKSKIDHICKGHSRVYSYSSENEAKKKSKEFKNTLRNDTTVASYDVDIDGSWLDGYEVKVSYKHYKNISACKRYREVKKIINSEKREIIREEWIDENGNYEGLLNDPEVTFLEKKCVDATPSKNINGLLISRPCWKESYGFIRKRKLIQEHDCDNLRKQKCNLLETKCIEGEEIDCHLWELTFHCQNVFKGFSFDSFSEQSYQSKPVEPNTSFSEVVTKLSVFKAMKEELAQAKGMDPSKIEIFKGSDKKCSKSVASNMIYDCCFSYSGLATQAHLAKCHTDEIALASLREQGQCHFIGIKENKALDLVTTDYEHVFCCFPTKLARVFNEQAREQLLISWGSASHPNCQGLTISQMQQINFNTIDLSEVFEENVNDLEQHYQEKSKEIKDPANSKSQLEKVKVRMKEKLRDEHEI